MSSYLTQATHPVLGRTEPLATSSTSFLSSLPFPKLLNNNKQLAIKEGELHPYI